MKNLFKLVPNSKIFLTRQYNSQIKTVDFIFRGKKPNWLKNGYPSKFHGLFRFLDKKLYHFAVSSLPEGILTNKIITARMSATLRPMAIFAREFPLFSILVSIEGRK